MQNLHPLLDTTEVPWGSITLVSRRRWGRNRSRDFRFRFMERGRFNCILTLKRLRIRSPERKLSCLNVLQSQDLPIQERGQSFRAISLVDSLTTGFEGELEHLVSELIHGFVDGFHASVDDVDSVVVGVFNEFFHVAPEAGEVGCNGGDSADDTFGRSVSPRFIVGGEYSQMTASNEVVVI
jgi:hypothetical protein